jgi:LysM repeat protein
MKQNLSAFQSIIPLSLAFLAACSPIKSSPHDQKHQLELTLHEVQTNLDDLRHDIHCFKTELQIIDGRIKHSENALNTVKQQDIEKQQIRNEQISNHLQMLEKRLAAFEKSSSADSEERRELISHAKEMTAVLVQFKNRIEELERELVVSQRRFEEFGKLKGTIESLANSLRPTDSQKTYKIKQGDSLDKIAKQHKTTVEKIKKLNGLQQDLIVVGQEIKIPND